MEEKNNFLSNEREVKLPIGFRFRPTDEELLVHYLKRKALDLPLPASVIPEFDVFLFDPWSLPGDVREKRYYFCKNGEKNSKCARIGTCSGYWKAVGKSRQVFGQRRQKEVIGTRKMWAFYKGNTFHGCRTRWVLHEYHLVDSTQNPTEQMQDWVVCRIFQRKLRPQNLGISFESCASSSNKGYNPGSEMPCYIDFKLHDCLDFEPPPISSPCSSGIPEIELDQDGPN